MFWLAILFLLLAVLDGLITFRVLSVYGLEAELNSLVRRFGKTDLKRGIVLGIAIPSVVLLFISALLHLPYFLGALVLGRVWLLYKQLKAHHGILFR